MVSVSISTADIVYRKKIRKDSLLSIPLCVFLSIYLNGAPIRKAQNIIDNYDFGRLIKIMVHRRIN